MRACAVDGAMRYGIIVACLTIAAASAWVLRDPVTIINEGVETKTLRVPGQAVPAQSQHALTTWFFHCVPTIRYDVIAEDAHTQRGFRCDLKVTAIDMKIGLTIQTTLPEQAAAAAVDHEQAHGQICRRIYRNADRVAHEICRSVIGTTFTAYGGTAKQARDGAVDQAAHSVCDRYIEAENGLTQKVSALFDAYTNHGLNGADNSRSIEQAFKEAAMY
jgi:hypothetical protein